MLALLIINFFIVCSLVLCAKFDGDFSIIFEENILEDDTYPVDIPDSTMRPDISGDYPSADIPVKSWEELFKNAMDFDPSISDTRNILDLKNKSIRIELERLFHKRFPFTKFSHRRYDVINWPVNVPKIKKHWSFNEVELIRLSLNTLRFVKRNEIFSTADEFGINRFDGIDFPQDDSMDLDSSMLMIFNRFKKESGWSEASKIDWKILDRSQLPSKYDSLEINSITMKLVKLHRNPEIVHNIHFHRYEDDVLRLKTPNALRRRKKPNVCAKEPVKNCVNDHVIEPSPLQSLEEFCETEGDVIVSEDTLIGEVPDYESFSNVFITEKSKSFLYSHSTEIQDVLDEIQRAFSAQFPYDGKFNFFSFDVINWPISVKKLKSVWSRKELSILKRSVKDFIFERRENQDDLSYESAMNLILTRFRTETGKSEAADIEWQYLNRSKLSKKYKKIEYNASIIKEQQFYRKPSIMKNLHFHKIDDDSQSNKRFIEFDDSQSNKKAKLEE